MFRTVLDEGVCKDVSRVRRFGYPPTADMVSLHFVDRRCDCSGKGDRFRIVRGDLKGVASSSYFLRPAGGIYISDERPLLHPRHRSFRRSPVARE